MLSLTEIEDSDNARRPSRQGNRISEALTAALVW
jgi:hypothetical protein